jgi:hypothetical protein
LFVSTGEKVVIDETTATDPFMMLITPVERYVAHSCFGTAVMSYDQGVSLHADISVRRTIDYGARRVGTCNSGKTRKHLYKRGVEESNDDFTFGLSRPQATENSGI